MLGQAEVAVEARHQHHVVGQVFALNLQLLHDDDVGLEDIEHGVEGAIVAPWLVAEGVADPVDIPRGDADHGVVWTRRAQCWAWMQLMPFFRRVSLPTASKRMLTTIGRRAATRLAQAR